MALDQTDRRPTESIMTIHSPFGFPAGEPERPGALWDSLNIPAIINGELSWYGENVDLALYVSSLCLREFMSSSWDYPASAIVFNQAFNDWLTLTSELAEGSGRSATRTARALVEHAINMADVAASSDMSERYMAHLSLIAEYQHDAQIGLSRLPARVRRSLIHRLKKAAKSEEQAIAASVARYGRQWRLKWSGDNLANRAARHGMNDLYKYYRIASLVMHGAAGGSLGSVRTVSGLDVHRTGPALHLCPMAFHEGHRAFLSVLSSAETVRPDMDFSGTKAVVVEFLDHFAEYRDLIVRLDEDVWPTSPPGEPRSVIAIARNGRTKWFWYDPQIGLLFEAEPPSLPDATNTALNDKVSDIIRSPETYLNEYDRWVVSELPPPPLSARKAGGRIISADAMAYAPRAEFDDLSD